MTLAFKNLSGGDLLAASAKPLGSFGTFLLLILILEHFVFRHGRYNVEDWNTRRKLPLGWAAIISALVGFVGVLLGAAQVYYVGPIANLFNPPDIGFELGLIFAGITYIFLRRIELNISRR